MTTFGWNWRTSPFHNEGHWDEGAVDELHVDAVL
jgi:hypothetical protein